MQTLRAPIANYTLHAYEYEQKVMLLLKKMGVAW